MSNSVVEHTADTKKQIIKPGITPFFSNLTFKLFFHFCEKKFSSIDARDYCLDIRDCKLEIKNKSILAKLRIYNDDGFDVDLQNQIYIEATIKLKRRELDKPAFYGNTIKLKDRFELMEKTYSNEKGYFTCNELIRHICDFHTELIKKGLIEFDRKYFEGLGEDAKNNSYAPYWGS
jgi:hypothetical protein